VLFEGERGHRTRRLFSLSALLLGCALVSSPAQSQSAETAPGGARWVMHRVLPGEKLEEIARRYATEEAAIVEDNTLEKPRLRAGQTLRVRAHRTPPPRKRISYVVRFGDNWTRIAEHHGVDRAALRRWNRQVPRTFEAGTELTIWVESDHQPPPPTHLGLDRNTAGLPLSEIAAGGESLGRPDRGRLRGGVQLPENPELYLVRRPDFAYGSSHAVENLQLALAKFRQHSGYGGPLVVSDMSRRRGRPFGSHDSHQSGRDVDIWLPLKAEVHAVRSFDPSTGDYREAAAARPSDIDWKATWELVKALLRTGEVQYIFLTRSRQRHLYAAARADGMALSALGDIVQFPRRAQTAIVRHAPNHTKHLHVRFTCAQAERRCR